jgi:hypothetical protein
MLCHIETCEGYKTYFPREYRKQFSRSSNPKPPLKEVHHLLFQMTFGQLELLKSQFGEECEAGQRGLANISAETVEAVLHSWRPIVNPDVEEVLPSDFPPVRIPSFFGLIDHRSIELEYGMFMDGCDEDFGIVSLSSPAASESMEDVVELAYPELYLPPELLHPTSDPAYIAAAVAAHEPGVEQISPLIPIPFPSIMEEIPWDCIEGVSTPMNEYEWIFLSLRGEEK